MKSLVKIEICAPTSFTGVLTRVPAMVLVAT